MNRILDFLNQLGPIKWYAAAMTAVYGCYLWVTIAGIKVSGDDNTSRSVATSGPRTHNHFYHK